ncbi:hypothetical protein SAMN05216496_2266 [Pseudomonas sp. Z003-0.4C(8344-21)]|jgi:hypothetical protein|nr:hypothetical protein SAMN05216496_2266 [Pseudomonas sp. Z003-0.4C(8344-21)]
MIWASILWIVAGSAFMGVGLSFMSPSNRFQHRYVLRRTIILECEDHGNIIRFWPLAAFMRDLCI